MATEANELAKIREQTRHDYASETLESISNRSKMISAQAAAEQAKTAAIRAGYDYEVGMGANAISARNAEINAVNASTRQSELALSREQLDQRRAEMYAGMANSGISALGRVGSTVLGNMTRKEPKVQKIYRILD